MIDRVINESSKRVTAPYGHYSDGSPHNGIDLGYRVNEEDNKVYANSKGVVYEVQDGLDRDIRATGKATWGNFVLVKHPNGMFSRYAHLSKGSITVKSGDEVNESSFLGIIGDSGITYGRHLHFEVATGYSSNTRIDPTSFLTKAIYEDSNENNEDVVDTEFNVGDKVVVKGRATSRSDGNGSQTALYGGNVNDISDIRYVTKIVDLNAVRPYHISVGQTFGDRDRGWVSKDQIRKI